MGNTMTDKRSYRREYHEYYEKCIQSYVNTYVLNSKEHADKDDPPAVRMQRRMKQHSSKGDVEERSIQVFIRKRPIFQHETDKNEFDILTCPPWGGMIVHICRQHPDLKPFHAFVESREFPFTSRSVFSEKDNTETVYRGSVRKLVQRTIRNGERGTCLMYGQTGTGKTYTITGVMRYLARDVIVELTRLKKASDGKKFYISAVCVELIGDNLYDLNGEGSQAHLLNDGQDVLIIGAEELSIRSAKEIVQAYDNAASMRETHATAINSSSSRSHYAFRLIIRDETESEFARLTMVDLAGSERNADSLYHDSERQKESALINSSLFALKDVIRVNAMNNMSKNSSSNNNKHVNYRASKLTLLLKDSFTSHRCRTVVISTMSPISTDTEHTMNTIQHLYMLTNVNAEKENFKSIRTNVSDVLGEALRSNQAPKIVHVTRWTAKDVKTWLHSANNGQFKRYASKFQDNMDGKQLARLTEQRFAQIVGNEAAGVAMRRSIQDHIKKYNVQRRREVKQQRDLMNGVLKVD